MPAESICEVSKHPSPLLNPSPMLVSFNTFYKPRSRHAHWGELQSEWSIINYAQESLNQHSYFALKFHVFPIPCPLYLINTFVYEVTYKSVYIICCFLFCFPLGIAVDKKGFVYFVDGTMIRKIDERGVITTVIGSNGLTSTQPLSCDSGMDISQVCRLSPWLQYTLSYSPYNRALQLCKAFNCRRYYPDLHNCCFQLQLYHEIGGVRFSCRTC